MCKIFTKSVKGVSIWKKIARYGNLNDMCCTVCSVLCVRSNMEQQILFPGTRRWPRGHCRRSDWAPTAWWWLRYLPISTGLGTQFLATHYPHKHPGKQRIDIANFHIGYDMWVPIRAGVLRKDIQYHWFGDNVAMPPAKTSGDCPAGKICMYIYLQ